MSGVLSNNDDEQERAFIRAVSYLTVFEYLVCRSVSKSWLTRITPLALQDMPCLALGQFFAVLGHEDFNLTPIALIGHQMTSLVSLDFSYCSFLDDKALAKCFSLILPTEVCDKITSLSLFHCPGITNAAVLNALNTFPNLTYLDLGSCRGLTDSVVSHIVRSGPHLEKLNLSYNINYTDEILIDLGSHPALTIVDLQKTHIDADLIEEQRINTPLLTICGPKIDLSTAANLNRPRRYEEE